MTLSRTALLLVAAPAAASAQPPAPDPVEAQRQAVLAAVSPGCAAATGDEIVVCGARDDSRYRLPYATEADAGARRPGEAADARSLLPLGAEPCTSARRPSKSDGLDVIAIALTAATLIVDAVSDRRPAPPPERRCS